MAQYEERYVALYGHIVKLLTYNNTTAGEMHIIDQDEVKKDTNMTWKISFIDFITATGAEFLRRATLEFQSCFMGNYMELLFGDDEPVIEIMDQHFMATVLDLCTARMAHLTIEQSKRDLEVIKSEYVKFFLKWCRYNQIIDSAASEPDKEEELVSYEDDSA